MGSKPKAPPLPPPSPPPPPAPTQEDIGITDEQKRLEEIRKRRGRISTILSGQTNVDTGNTLLGG